MGILNWFSKVGKKIYNGVKKPITRGYHFLKDAVNTVGKVGNWIDGTLNELHGVPVVGELASMLQNSPIYRDVAAGFHEAESLVDLAGEVGRGIESAVEGGGGSGPVTGLNRANQLTERSVPQRSALSGLDTSSISLG